MKKFKTILITMLAASLVLALAACTVKTNGNSKPGSAAASSSAAGSATGSNAYSGDLKLVQTTQLSLDGINNIEFDLDVAEVEVFVSKSDKIEVVEYGSQGYTPAHYTANKSLAGTLEFFHNDENIVWNNLTARCEVYLPQGYSGGLSIGVAVGGVTITNAFTLAFLDIDIEVGNAKLENLALPKLEVDVEVGNIDFGVPKNYAFNYFFETNLGEIESTIAEIPSTSMKGSYGQNPTANVQLGAEIGIIKVYGV